jgi:hypothetical protein
MKVPYLKELGAVVVIPRSYVGSKGPFVGGSLSQTPAYLHQIADLPRRHGTALLALARVKHILPPKNDRYCGRKKLRK